MSELVFGVDFGTTYSTVAAADGKRTWVVEGAGGDRVTPTVVHLGKDGKRLVGEPAVQRSILEPERTVVGVKRLLGRAFDTHVVQQFRSTVAYAIEPDDQRYCAVSVDGRHYSPGEIATAVFSALRDRARAATGASVVSAVVTAPAHFGAAQRRAIHAAATRAEIDVVRVLAEPTAASVAFGARAKPGERVLIYDLGGGTFDVTVLRIEEDVHEILAVGGHPLLGGLDFDNAIVEDLESQILMQTGRAVNEDPVALRRMRLEAEGMKRELSDVMQVERTVPQLLAGHDVRLRYTRQAFEARIARLIERSIEIARNTLRDSGLHEREIDHVLLVGGSTRVPRVREALREAFGDKLSHAVHPQEAVAVGAATFAASLGTERAMRMLDVLPASVGIAGERGEMVPLIKHNTMLPCEGSFELGLDGHEAHELVLYQGEDEYVSENEALGSIALSVDGAPIEGIITVSAFDTTTGRVLRTQFSMRVNQRMSAWAR
jgi:molecular chaperone DnaK